MSTRDDEVTAMAAFAKATASELLAVVRELELAIAQQTIEKGKGR